MTTFRYTLDKISPTPLTDKSIVLDLDETLIHTFHDDGAESLDLLSKLNIFKDPKKIKYRKRLYKLTMENVVDEHGSGKRYQMWGITRPYLKNFLIFCFSYFKIVAVWSAGLPKYVDAMVNYIFRDLPDPHIVFARDKCVSFNGKLIKPLTKMINDIPELHTVMSLKTTFVIDDRKSTFSKNANNGIKIPAYTPEIKLEDFDQDDTCLYNLVQYFMKDKVRLSKDVQSLPKNIYT
jgi:TFIIF-interacting CTD phosphatase-like protein